MKINKKIKKIIKITTITVVGLVIIVMFSSVYSNLVSRTSSHMETAEEREQSQNKHDLKNRLTAFAARHVLQHFHEIGLDRKSLEDQLKWEEQIDWTYPPEKSSDPDKNIFNVAKYSPKGQLRNLSELKRISGTDKILFTRSVRIEGMGIEEAEMLLVLPNVFPYQCDFKTDFFKVVEMTKAEFESKIKFWPEQGDQIVEFPNSRMGCIKVGDEYHHYALIIIH